jgi:hypothetical protein
MKRRETKSGDYPKSLAESAAALLPLCFPRDSRWRSPGLFGSVLGILLALYFQQQKRGTQ